MRHREREPKPEPIKSAGIRDWLVRAQEEGVVSEQEAEVLIHENEAAKRRIIEEGLPTFAIYGPRDSLERVEKLIPKSERDSPDRLFLVRCAPRKMSSKLQIQRNMGIPWEQVVNFVGHLPGGKENYTVEVREHWNADYAGAIIGNGGGKVLMEMIKGDLVNLDKKGDKEIMNARYDTNQFDFGFSYTEGMTEEQRQIMIGALRYVMPEITRENLGKLKIYLEFAYKKEYGYRFLDISDRDFWTKL